MTTAAPSIPAHVDATGRNPWTPVVGWAAATIAAVDVLFLTLVGELIPPVAIAALVTALGIGLLRVRPRGGASFLAIWSLLWAVGSVPFVVTHLTHPESGIDFVHSVVSGPGRLLLAGAAVAAWRGLAPASARRSGLVAMVGLGLVAATGVVATVASSGAAAAAGDEIAPVRQAAFPDSMAVASGGTLFVDNQDLFRHTFTVEGTGVDVELPAKQGVRIPIDLAAGTYEVQCRVPGHESMQATLTVTP